MMDTLQKYDPRTLDVLVPLLSVAARVSEGGVESVSPQEMAKLRGQLEQMMAALHARTPLSVEKMCYCRRITNYGLYDPLPNDHLFAGGDRHHVELVQLYVEARNFASKQNGNVYETSLGSKLEIKNTRGELVARMDFPAKPDHSLSPRQDYFIHYQFYVPAQMEPGEYKLTITLQDENATGDQKQAVRRTLFTVFCTFAARHPHALRAERPKQGVYLCGYGGAFMVSERRPWGWSGPPHEKCGRLRRKEPCGHPR